MESNILDSKKTQSVIWKLGLPMIISMLLQALYNVVDTAFVINMGSDGVFANLALTYAFPIQILMIAVGVGTGVGINAMLSRSLGEGDKIKANKVAGNGIFIGVILTLIFVVFGIFGAEPFIRMQANGNEKVVEMGTTYLQIVCIVSIGSMGFTVVERFLQATGKTMYSTIGQISGAITNIVLDWLFIYPLGMGVAGAAWATVIGQIVSLIIVLLLHIFKNPQIDKSVKFIKPNGKIIKGIYHIGLSAMLMQGLLSVMMLGVNLILGTSSDYEILTGTFGIYYKIQQLALFACFGLSNTLITIVSFNLGMKNKKKLNELVKYGIIDSVIVSGVILVLFEILAYPIAYLFGLSTGGVSSDIVGVCTNAIRIASIGYVFMGVIVGIQGILQGLRKALTPLLLSLYRLAVFLLPLVYIFTLTNNPRITVWLAFPIAELITMIIAFIFMRTTKKNIIDNISDEEITVENYAICISRTHGSQGKLIGKLLAEKLGISYYDKELALLTAKESGLSEVYIGNLDENPIAFYDLYLSLDVNQTAIIAQSEVIKKIANQSNCVIVGRGANYILRSKKKFSIFLNAPIEYRISKVMEMYGDNYEQAKENIIKSDLARKTYYEKITSLSWNDASSYDLVIDTSIGVEETVDLIIENLRKNKKFIL